MRYRSLGKWPLKISEVGFGTGDNAGIMVHGSSRQQIEVIERALGLGINLFDTSAAYGKGAAEVNLGRVLKDLSAHDVHVSTKVLIPRHDFGRIRDRIRDSLEESLLRLRRDHVDILLLHNPVRETHDPDNQLIIPLTAAQVMADALPAMVKAREQGKVRLLGLACDESESLSARPILASGEFAMVNFAYNLCNPSAALPVPGIPFDENFEGLFEVARQHDAWVAVVRPLAGGALAGAMIEHGLQALHPYSKGYFRMLPQVHKPMLDAAKAFQFLHRPSSQTLAQAAYRFILAHPQVATVIGGFSEIAQMEEAAAAADAGRLSEEDVRRVAAIHQQGFVRHAIS